MGAVWCVNRRLPTHPENGVGDGERGVAGAARAHRGDGVVAARGRGLQQRLPRGQRVGKGRERGHVIGRAISLGAGARAPPVAKGLQRGVVRGVHSVERRAIGGHRHLHASRGRVQVAIDGRGRGRALQHHVVAEARVKAPEQRGGGGGGGGAALPGCSSTLVAAQPRARRARAQGRMVKNAVEVGGHAANILILLLGP